MKQKHKYEVDKHVWYGKYYATVTKRLDNKMYQIEFETWQGHCIYVVSEHELSLKEKNEAKNEV